MKPVLGSRVTWAACGFVAISLLVWVRVRSGPHTEQSGLFQEPSLASDGKDGAPELASAPHVRTSIPGSVSPVVDNENDGVVELSFVDPHEAALPDVLVYTVPSQGKSMERPSWNSDRRGKLVLPCAGLPERIFAWKQGFAATRVVTSCPGNQRIVLEPEVEIRGWLVLDSGLPPPEGTTVIAFPPSHRPTESELRAAMSGRPSEVVAGSSRAGGEFVLGGLARGSSLALLAGGHGYVVPSSAVVVTSPAKDVELRLQPAFGAVVRFTEKGGIALRTAPLMWAPPGPQWTWHLPGVTGVPTNSIWTVLLGSSIGSTDTVGAFETVLLFAAPSGDSVGPVHVRGDLAGYEHFEAELTIPALRGDPAQKLVELTPVATHWGRVHVGWKLPSSYPSSVAPASAPFLARVMFEESGTGRRVLYHPVVDLAAGGIDIDGVPAGDYTVSLVTPHARFPEAFGATAPFVAISTTPSRVELDLSRAQWLEFEILEPTGEPFTGEAAVEIGRTIEGRTYSTFVSMPSRPYVVFGLPLGGVSARLHKPFMQPKVVVIDFVSPSTSNRVTVRR